GPCGCEPGRCRRLAESELAQDTAILLPLYHHMTEADQDRVCAALSAAVS
ncbi:MAG TPA: aminotransferase DegT, partial [Phycisphaerae bacterium]|nr:aminotransferase DegT [Phycisphaerae bacterium]